MRKIRKQCQRCVEHVQKYDYDLCLISPRGKMSWEQTEKDCKDFREDEKT